VESRRAVAHQQRRALALHTAPRMSDGWSQPWMARLQEENFEEELLRGLNPAQQTAVKAPPGPMIVLAGPGSGKTRVLTSRIALLMKQGADPSSIVAVTFTNKAANEMRQRVKKALGIKHDSDLQVTVGTFHKVCLNILREFGHLLGLEPNFLIFDADQQKELVAQAMGELGLSTETMSPNTIRFAISNLKSQNLGPEGAANFQQRDGSAAWNPRFVTTVQHVYELYQVLPQPIESSGELREIWRAAPIERPKP
jgi:superfamily I DNA/RNA helicase